MTAGPAAQDARRGPGLADMAPAIGASQIGASSPTNWQSSSSSSLGWSLSPFGTPSSNARGLPLILLSFSRPLRLLRPLGVATVIDPTS